MKRKKNDTSIEINSELSSQAITKTDDSKSFEEKSDKKKISKMNGFDFASHLMMGAINPLVSNNSKIKRETVFMADGKASSCISYLKELLEKLKCSPTVNGNDIKCFKTINNALLNFNFSIIEITGEVCFVEVRRGKGDILDFNKLYREITEKCEIALKKD